ncbi:hypothetical protein Trydic_g3146 [Trypoxylus dichotomus]
MWPGWKDYHAKCTTNIAKAEYHNRFKEYLALKLKCIIERKETFVPLTKLSTDSKMVQTDLDINIKANKPEAPYHLLIAGQPAFLNNIGFIESSGDVILTQHQGRPLSHLNLRQLLNYPHIKVNVQFMDMEFSRASCHKFIRYISESKDSIICPETNFIDYVQVSDTLQDVKVYTLDYISAYCKQFLEVAKTLYMVRKVNMSKLIELEVVIKQFLRDIQESDVQRHLAINGKVVNTMATNMTVCYNIGNMTYVRNKKMAYSNYSEKSKTINFCEIIIPKIEYTLKKFSAEEDVEAADVSFRSLSSQSTRLSRELNERNKFSDMIKGSITYECSWCKDSFTGEFACNSIMNHFKTVHKGEQAVVCFKCRKEFGIAHLAGSRWAHGCGKREEKEVTSSMIQVDANSANDANVLSGERNSKCHTPDIEFLQSSEQVSSTAEIISLCNEDSEEKTAAGSSDDIVNNEGRTDSTNINNVVLEVEVN